MLCNILKQSTYLKPQFLSLGIIILALDLLLLVRTCSEDIFENIWLVFVASIWLVWCLGILRVFFGFANALKASSANHIQVYQTTRLNLCKEDQLKVNSWAPIEFWIAKAVEIGNEQFLVLMNDYLMNLFFTMLLGL